MIHVFFHGPACPDGFCSYWVASNVLGSNATYYPINYGDQFPELPLSRGTPDTIYFLDFSLPRDQLLSLAEAGFEVIVLDHHKTAQDALAGLEHPNLTIVFDMTQSGAMLTWKWFHKTRPVPPLVEYVQDRDLWTWKLPHSKEISAAIDLTDRTMDDWNLLTYRLVDEHGNREIIEIGTSILKYQTQKVNSLASKAEIIALGDRFVPAVNSSIFQSEIGNRLLEIHPNCKFAVVYFYKDANTKVFSLRSRKDFDCSEIAKQFGGGGHPQACGFSLKVTETVVEL